jgi:hypothetical protein
MPRIKETCTNLAFWKKVLILSFPCKRESRIPEERTWIPAGVYLDENLGRNDEPTKWS